MLSLPIRKSTDANFSKLMCVCHIAAIREFADHGKGNVRSCGKKPNSPGRPFRPCGGRRAREARPGEGRGSSRAAAGSLRSRSPRRRLHAANGSRRSASRVRAGATQSKTEEYGERARCRDR
jgi:hypothetical protein